MSNFYVHVKNADTNEVVKELGPMSEDKAIKCANGMDINLADDFYTEVVDRPLSSDGGESTAQSSAVAGPTGDKLGLDGLGGSSVRVNPVCPTDKEK